MVGGPFILYQMLHVYTLWQSFGVWKLYIHLVHEHSLQVNADMH